MHNISTNPSCVNSEDGTTSAPLSITWGGQIYLPTKNLPKFQTFNSLDTLHIGLFVEWKKFELFNEMEKAKRECMEDDYKTRPFHMKGFENFVVYPNGKKGGYGWHISTADIHIFFSRHNPHGSTPNVFVEIGSISCWSRGIDDVMRYLDLLLNLEGGYVFKRKINRVDMAVDFVGVDIHETEIFDRAKWVKKAREYEINGSGHRDNTARFGFSKRGVIGLRVYDKLLELKNDPAKLKIFKEIWNVPMDEDVPVTRLEFQLRKDALKEFDCHDYDDFDENIQGIWKYLTHDWFRLCKKVHRKKTQLAKNTEWWDVVAETKWSEQFSYVERRRLNPSKAIEPLIDQAAGIAISVCAYMKHSVHDIEGIINTFQEKMKEKLMYLYNNKHSDFVDKFQVRQSNCWDSLFNSTIPELG